MGMRPGVQGWRVAAAALFVLAQLTLGLAHRPIASPSLPPSAARVDLAAYALPDGTVPDICLNGGDEGTVLKSRPCDACVLTSAPGLAAAPEPALVPPDGRRIAHLAMRSEPRDSEKARGAQARAPPLA